MRTAILHDLPRMTKPHPLILPTPSSPDPARRTHPPLHCCCVPHRSKHFALARRPAAAGTPPRAVIPKAVLRLLHDETTNSPPALGLNVRYEVGRFSTNGERYVANVPESLQSCAVWRTNATDQTSKIEFVRPADNQTLC